MTAHIRGLIQTLTTDALTMRISLILEEEEDEGIEKFIKKWLDRFRIDLMDGVVDVEGKQGKETRHHVASKIGKFAEVNQIKSASSDFQCIVCGEHSEQIKYFQIIPRTMRSSFPEEWKEKHKGPTARVCPSCHSRCHRFQQARVKDLRDDFEVDRISDQQVEKQFIFNTPNFLIWKAANALLRNENEGSSLPVEKKEMFYNRIMTHAGLSNSSEVSVDLLKKLLKLPYRAKNPRYMTPEQRIVATVTEEEGYDGIERFVQDWIDCFELALHCTLE